MFLLLVACTADHPDTSADPVGSDSGVGDTADSAGDSQDTEDTEDTAPSVCAAAGWAWGAELRLDDADASFFGGTDDELAALVSTPGDLDGDGAEELGVGAPGWGDALGRVYLVRSGFTRALDQPLAGQTHVDGTLADMQLWRAVPLGDTNGDGLDDVVFESGYSSTNAAAGLTVLFGSAGAWPDIDLDGGDGVVRGGSGFDAVVRLQGDGPLGDFDGDGAADLLTHRGTTGAGEVHVVSGAALSGEATVPDDATFWVDGGGLSLVPGARGDFDGDGRGDLLLTDTTTEWSYLVLGGNTAQGDTIRDAADVSVFGEAGAAVGDIDGDGLADFVTFKGGRAYLFTGRTGWPAGVGDNDAFRIGEPDSVRSVAGVGDLDGDGRDDLATVERIDGEDTVLVYLGRSAWPATLTPADATLRVTPEAGLLDGESGLAARADLPEVRRVDLDGDRLDDLLVVFPGVDAAGEADVGRVFGFRGRTSWPASLSTADADLRIGGARQGDALGTRNTIGVGDLDGDGCDDVILGSLARPDASKSGAVYVWFGQNAG